MIHYQTNTVPKQDALVELYTSVGWLRYTQNPASLLTAVENSFIVATAWQETELVGLIRGISDGESILYIQDLLVKPAYQGQGIGSHLIQGVLSRYPAIRQIMLLTDEKEKNRHFYEKQGFSSCDQGELVAFYRAN